MAITNDQRFTKANPCPVCGYYDRAARGQGIRCFGFLSPDGGLAFCTRSEQAGGLSFNAESETYTHQLTGACGCGTTHGPAPDAPAAVRAPRGETEAVYDYHDERGQLLFQVVRVLKPTGGKTFYQRRPDGNGGWVNKLGRVRRVLYRLPQVLAAPPEQPVFVVEGEKDVNRLWSEGLVATTNPQGALKWRQEYAQSLNGRHIIVIPDNDPPDLEKITEHLKGQKHAAIVAKSLSRQGTTVKVLELPDLPPKGDVSDWLNAGGTVDQLLDLAAAAPESTLENPYRPGGTGSPGENGDGEAALLDVFIPSKHRPGATQVMRDGLLMRGRFIRAEDGFYYFDDGRKSICELSSFAMKVLLRESYGVNSTEGFYNYLLEEMKVECDERGMKAKISTLAHYDSKANLLFLDQGEGRMLKLDGKTITEESNGSYGVLFAQLRGMEPWTFVPDPPKGLIGDMIIRSLNFVVGDQTPHTSAEQELLLYIWLLSLAFETVQPTKPLALAVGPPRSGKSLLFRRIGRMLYGPTFQVDTLRRDGEADFLVAVTNNAFVAFDNADGYIPWLEDALAACATGMRITKRILHTTNEAGSFEAKAFIALTAHSPQFRRTDVSQRLLLFRLERLSASDTLGENELLEIVTERRNELMSEYALALNKVVAAPRITDSATDVRMADFANVAMRIGDGLGAADQTKAILAKLNEAQQIFATEENSLYLLLDIWTKQDSTAGPMQLRTPNNNREVSAEDLFQEMAALAEIHGYRFWHKNKITLGRELKGITEGLQLHFDVEQGHREKGNWWKFTRLKEPEDAEE